MLRVSAGHAAWLYGELDVCRIQWCRWLGAGRPVTTETMTTAVTGAREVTETGPHVTTGSPDNKFPEKTVVLISPRITVS